jgi:tRNA pseudouridine13 synthase
MLSSLPASALQDLMVPLPYRTADLPGIGGIIKQQPEDFVVDEIPAYTPSGTGEFLYLWVEKRDLSHEQLISHLARELAIAQQDIGAAGMKDRQALSRQWLSVPIRCQEHVVSLQHERIKILETGRHGNKLRTGHTRGNRFSILVRGVKPDALERATAIVGLLAARGFPNYFGDQRFGREAETLKTGLALLSGTMKPVDIPRARRKFLLRLSLSAVQSALFNRGLAARMNDGLLDRVLVGDVMQVAASGGPFVVEDAAIEQARFDAGETIISGPIFGPKMKRPAGEPSEREAALLAAAGISLEAFSQFASLTPGTRRPYLFRAEGLTLTEEPVGLRLAFSLPSGCYATVVLRELQKN